MLEVELTDMILSNLEKKVSYMLAQNRKYSEFIDRLARKEIDPYVAGRRTGNYPLRVTIIMASETFKTDSNIPVKRVFTNNDLKNYDGLC